MNLLHKILSFLSNSAIILSIFLTTNCADDNKKRESVCKDSNVYDGSYSISDGRCKDDEGCQEDATRYEKTNIEDIEGCEEINGNLKIFHNDLKNLDALSSLKKVGGNLRIGHYDGYDPSLTNNNLSEISGLSNLEWVGGELEVACNKKLKNLDGLENLTYVGGGVVLHYNPLNSIEGLSGLENIPGDFYIYGSELVSIPDFTNLRHITGTLTIYNAIYLKYINLINLLTLDGVYLGENPSLVNVNFKSLEKINKISVYKMVNIKSIELPNLTKYDVRHVDINTTGLENLDGFSKIKMIEERLAIKNNNLLTDLSGLFNIYQITGSLQIYSNSKLTDEKAWELVDVIGEENIVNIYIKDNY
jgi:hypothetical protein